MSASVAVRPAVPDDDRLLARHFFAMWRDNDVPTSSIVTDWEARILDFIADARARLDFQAFLAVDGDAIAGSAGCQRFAGLYPDVLDPALRVYGYIWGIYVEPDYRCRGVARRLTEAALDHLRAIGCTKALLHSSPHGRTVYDKLGFTPTNEMALDL